MTALTPFPYQMDGIFFLAGRDRCALTDDAGLGKSMQAIRAASALGLGRILVICPPIGRVSWADQFAKWDTDARPVHHYPQDGPSLPSGPVAVIVTTTFLSNQKRRDRLRRALDMCEGFDLAVLDEAQNLKTPTSQRTKSVYGARLDLNGTAILRDVRRVWVLSATLTPLNVSELYTHLKALFPETLARLFHGVMPTHRAFIERFCETRHNGFGIEIVGNNDRTIPDLRSAIYNNVMGRRAVDVLPSMPKATTDVLGLELAQPSVVKAARAAFLADPDALTDDEFLDRLARSYEEHEHATRRRNLGELKGKAALAHICAWLDEAPDVKVLVFAHHRVTLDVLKHALAAAGHASVEIHGGVNAAGRAQAVADFQDRPDTRVFLGQNRAANTSITLTAASVVLLLEPDPSPDENYQAVARAARLGQTRPVRAYFAYAEGHPIERRAAQILDRRANDNADLFGVSARGNAPTRSSNQ